LGLKYDTLGGSRQINNFTYIPCVLHGLGLIFPLLKEIPGVTGATCERDRQKRSLPALLVELGCTCNARNNKQSLKINAATKDEASQVEDDGQAVSKDGSQIDSMRFKGLP